MLYGVLYAVTNFTPRGASLYYLGTEQVPVHEEKDGLERFGGRKFIIGMTLIIVASIFTGIGTMTIDQWLYFTGVVGASYFGINFIQKKAL